MRSAGGSRNPSCVAVLRCVRGEEVRKSRDDDRARLARPRPGRRQPGAGLTACHR